MLTDAPEGAFAAAPEGPYEKAPGPIMSQVASNATGHYFTGPGHNSVIHVPDNDVDVIYVSPIENISNDKKDINEELNFILLQFHS